MSPKQNLICTKTGQNLKAHPVIGSADVLVIWDRPSAAAGAHSYRLYRTCASARDELDHWILVIEGKDLTHAQVCGLLPYTLYKVCKYAKFITFIYNKVENYHLLVQLMMSNNCSNDNDLTCLLAGTECFCFCLLFGFVCLVLCLLFVILLLQFRVQTVSMVSGCTSTSATVLVRTNPGLIFLSTLRLRDPHLYLI